MQTITLCRLTLSGSALCASLAAPLASRATEAPEVLLEDDFAILNPDLGKVPTGYSISDNALHVSHDSETWSRRFYQNKRFKDFDATIRVRMPDFNADHDSKGGLAFWADDNDNFYALTITDWGACGVFRVDGGRFRQAATFRKVEGVKTAPGDWNELRVVGQGNVAALYVNGRQFAAIKGRPPSEGGLVGFFAYPGDAPIDVEFAALKVVRPVDKPALTLAADADDVLYDLDPAFPDPAFGAPEERLGWNEGRLFIEAAPSNVKWQFYLGDMAQNMSVTAKVRMTDGDAASVGGAGLAFWGVSNDDLFVFVFRDDGKAEVAHYVDKKFTYHHRAPVPAEANVKLDDWIEMKVVTEKDKANFWINGVKIGVVFQKSPQGESKFGVVSSSGATPCRAEFAEIKALRLPATAAPK